MHALCPARRDDSVYLPGELEERSVRFDKPLGDCHVYVSRHNPGALEVLKLCTSSAACLSRRERYLSKLALGSPSAKVAPP